MRKTGKDEETIIPEEIIDYFNYPEQKKILDDFKERFNAIEKNRQLNSEQKKQTRKDLNTYKLSEFGKKIDPEFDVYREIKGNPYSSFRKLFDNFYQNPCFPHWDTLKIFFNNLTLSH